MDLPPALFVLEGCFLRRKGSPATIFDIGGGLLEATGTFLPHYLRLDGEV